MTAAVLYGKEDVKIERVPIPRVGDGEVLVKVQVALTCGTDLKVYQRGYHARMIVPPALFGHELAGVIEEVGHGVRGFKKGMRVVALNSAPCQMCFYCSKHQENLCEDLLFNNGAYAEYIRIPRRIVETNMLAVPADVTYEEAAMVEPLACVLRGLHETGGSYTALLKVFNLPATDYKRFHAFLYQQECNLPVATYRRRGPRRLRDAGGSERQVA